MSSKRPGRPVFNGMIKRLKKGEADGIIAWHPDRLSRNAVDAGQIIDLVDRGKLQNLKFQSYRFENSPEGKWMLGIVLGQSKYFVDKLSKDVLRGLQSKVTKGHCPQKAPVGYINDKTEHTIVADPIRFPIMRRAFELLIHGGVTPNEVLDKLNNDWGFRTLTRQKSGGGRLSRSSFYRIITNPFYTGMFKYNGDLHPGKHPAMLTHAEFERLQRMFGNEGDKSQSKPQKKQLTFQGLIRCGNCGCSITHTSHVKVYTNSGRRVAYSYFHCSNGKGGCTKCSVTEEYLEETIGSLVRSVKVPQEALNWLNDAADRWTDGFQDVQETTDTVREKSLEGARRRLRNLINTQIEDPTMFTPEEFKNEKAKISSEIVSLETQGAASAERKANAFQSVVNATRFAASARQRFDSGDPEVRRQVISRLAQNYFLTLGKLEFTLHPLLRPFVTIEPREIGSDKVKSPSSTPLNPCWGG